MKNKPLRHKETNTFKFIPFSERITNLHIDVFHYVSCVPDDDDEGTTYLYRAIDKWTVQNGTLGMDSCVRELPPCTSLPQLLHQKEQAVDVLLKNLNMMDPLTLQPVLELLIALARDLRQEFYPYFGRTLESLFSLISSSRDPDVLEWAFQCLAYLLKFLWKSLLREPASLVYHRALPLLQDSKPGYIRDFAAQCFAFVTRKVRDKLGFISAMLAQLQEADDGVSGTGRLLCETLSGVSGTLHSTAPALLQLLLASLGNDALPTELHKEVLVQTLTALSTKVKPVNWGPFWEAVEVTLQEFQKTEKWEAACRLLSLTQLAVELRGGTLVIDSPLLIRTLTPLLSCQNQDAVRKAAMDVAASLLCAPGLSLTQEHSATLSALAMSTDTPHLLLSFISRVLSCPGFKFHILPKFLKFCQSNPIFTTLTSESSSFLKLLAKLITVKSPPCHSGIELPSWKQYALDLGTDTLIVKLILDQLTKNKDYEELVSCLIILPHIKNCESQEKLVLSQIQRSCLESNDSKSELFLFGLAIEAAVHCKVNVDRELLNKIVEKCIRHNPELCALRSLDLVITAKKSEELKTELFDKLMQENLHHNLSSPNHKVRVLTCHIMSELESGSLFGYLLKTENTPATIDQYRERLQKLGNLEPLHLATLAKEPYAADLALRFLIGQLYVNFKLIWEPVSASIAAHAQSQAVAQFWPVIVSHLQLAVQRVLAGATTVVTPPEQLTDEGLQELYIELESQLDNPDHVNFRCLLWGCLTLFPELCETHSRDLAPLFLNFLKDEFHQSEASDSHLWNALKPAMEDSKMDVDLPESENDLQDDEPEVEEKKPRAKTATRTLISLLQLFCKLRNPRAMHRESELSGAYHDLLKHRNSVVQKLALDCVMQYKHSSLIPYKEQLYGLIDDKGFKSQLIKFSLDSEGDNIVLPEHRPVLVPVLMSILYSKMQGKGTTRRTVILRFLSNCVEDELLAFLKLAFKHHLVEGSPLEMTENVMNSINLQKLVPPKRLTSAINLATTVLAHLGRNEGGMPRCTSLLVRVLLVIAARVAGVTKRKHEVAKFALAALRSTRKAVTEAIGRVFARGNAGDATTTYKWTEEELDAVFEVVVWPWVEQLAVESALCPTSLLKLFITWSNNPKFFPLLVKHPEGRPEVTALASMVTLLCTEGTKPPVTSAVLEVCQRLLTLVPDEGEDEEELPISHVFKTEPESIARLKLSEPLNYGSEILLPHVTQLLSYLHRRAAVATSKKRKTGGLNPRELAVLSRISEMVTDPASSLALLELIVPLCLRKSQLGCGDSTLGPLLITLENLLRVVEPPENLALQITPMFSTATGRQSRQTLCNILFMLIPKSEAKIIADLNSWEPRRVEDPNFEKRISAFTEVTKMEDLSLELGLLVIHNCYHTLKVEKDISLRDCSSHCLQTVCPLLAQKHAEDPLKRTMVLERTVMELLRRGVRDKNETVQEELLSLLGVMVRKCGDLHPTLRDLQGLASENDPEVDFFENIRHLQVHRRSRALLRFCQVAKETRMRPLTLTQFILPLTSIFLCNEKYARINSMVDAAIETVGVVCSQLPWPQYEAVLKFQLSRMPRMYDYQRQMVRTVVAVLDAFHFDLSNAAKARLPRRQRKPHGKPELKTAKTEENVAEEVEVDVEIAENDVESEKIDENLVQIDVESPKTDAEVTKTDEDAKTADEPEVSDEPEVTEDQKEEEELVAALETAPENAPVVEKPLPEEMATRVRQTILHQLLPRLQGVISARTAKDSVHKVNRNQQDPGDEREREAQEVLRVPIAVAIVKLLQKLPPGALEQGLSGVLLKVCVFLRSRLEPTRRVARDTLKQILQALGPRYLRTILGELTSLLTRGYQIHVLIYTVHSLIVTAAGILGPGDIDPCLQSVIAVCKADLFGDAAEEKEVAQIAGKVVEARSNKSYDTLHLLARFASEKCLTDLLIPLRDVIRTTQNYKVVMRVAACLRQLVQGLSENTFVASESLLMFAYGAASESLPALTIAITDLRPKEKLTDAQKAIQRPDTFLIEPAPKRSGPVSKKSLTTHAHHFVAFGLHLLHFLLKRDRVSKVPAAMLDPFVDVLVPCLQSQHTKLTTLTLQCLAWMLKFNLPSLQKKIGDITNEVFKLLHKFAGSGQGKGDTFDLANAAFKVVGVLVRDITYHKLTDEQTRLVLLYAERDVQSTGDSARQATAFTLLRASLRRRVHTEELTQVMHTVATLAVASETAYVRQNSRLVYMYYLTHYQLNKRQLEDQTTFLLSQLSYERQTGRDSVLEMLQTLVTSLPLPRLTRLATLLYISVAARLINDEAPDCRKAAAKLLKSLLHRLPEKDRQQLFEATLLWLRDKKVQHRRLAVQLCGIFSTVERDQFNKRLPIILPLLSKELCPNSGPGRFVRAPTEETEPETDEHQTGTNQDHLLFQTLQLLIKISTKLPKWFIKYPEESMTICNELQRYLPHSHEWVRLAAVQLVGCVFATLDPVTIGKAMREKLEDENLLLFSTDTERHVKSLTLDLCDLLQIGISVQFAEQVVKNLIYLARVVRHGTTEEVSLPWMAKKIRRAVNEEVARAPANSVLRCAALKWSAGVTLEMGEDLVNHPVLLHHLLAPVAREITESANAPPVLKKLAKEVASLVKKQIGVEDFARAMSKLQTKMIERRETRKRKIAQEVISDPERSAQRKIRKQQVKKVAKKRKIDQFKGRIRKNFRDTEEQLDF